MDSGYGDALDVIRAALKEHLSNIALACSFQAEDLAVLDMMVSIDQGVRVFALDTGRLNDETYEVAEKVRQRYGVAIQWMFPDRVEVEALMRRSGAYSFVESVSARKECCRIRKVEPLKRALQGLTGWITGMRREQAVTRDSLATIEVDHVNGGITKYNPIADWSVEDTWRYLHEHGVPFNRLYERGYRQIGCAPCTTSVKPGEDDRAGRWRWEDEATKECGLHVDGSGI